MVQNPGFPFQRFGRTLRRLLPLLLVILVLGACYAAQPLPGDERVPIASDAQEAGAFASPLAADSQRIEPWRVVSIVQEGEELHFEELSPVYVEINTNNLGVTIPICQTGGWPISLVGDGRYVKGDGAFSANDCEEPQDILRPQAEAVFDAFRNTNRYAFQNGRLILSGDDLRVELSPSSYEEIAESRERIEEQARQRFDEESKTPFPATQD